MDWNEIEMKWGEMTRRVQSKPCLPPASIDRTPRASEPMEEAIIEPPTALVAE